MAYNALTIGLPDELFTALQSLTVQHDLTLTASFTVQEAGRLLGQQAFHLLIVDLDYLRSMQFSFIGWDILSSLTLGIGALWLRPYKQAATAAFYREITGTEHIGEEFVDF